MNIIEVKNLVKKYTYNVKNKDKGFIYNLFNSKSVETNAVNDISFTIQEGETVSFIGPNGAGKSTTIKIITGILHSTSGSVSICGLTPIKDRDKISYMIGTVFGQRSQLLPNLPLTESMYMYGAIYNMSDGDIKKRIEELSSLFDLGEFLNKAVRKLSLGERMRAEIALSLIHRPKIIFLDEPTIGLDVIAKKKLRDLLRKINKEEKVTIFLTSHDTMDIESICDRCIIINHGEIILDIKTKDLMKDYIKNKQIIITPDDTFNEFYSLDKGMDYVTKDSDKIIVKINTELITIKNALQRLTKLYEIEDISIVNESLDEIIGDIYEK